MKRSWRNILYTIWDVSWISLDRRLSTAKSKFSLRLQGCPYGYDLMTTGPCSFKARREGSIRLGSSVRLLGGWRSNRVGLTGPTLLQTFEVGEIEIGNKSGGSAVILSSRSKILIGTRVSLGGNVRIFDHDFHPLEIENRRKISSEQEPHIRTAPVTIGNDVFIGTNAIVLKGVSLGAGTIVGAGAVVTQSFPEGSLVTGNPARLTLSRPRVG